MYGTRSTRKHRGRKPKWRFFCKCISRSWWKKTTTALALKLNFSPRIGDGRNKRKILRFCVYDHAFFEPFFLLRLHNIYDIYAIRFSLYRAKWGKIIQHVGNVVQSAKWKILSPCAYICEYTVRVLDFLASKINKYIWKWKQWSRMNTQ